MPGPDPRLPATPAPDEHRPGAAADPIGAMYADLHKLARRHLARGAGHTLQPTALVNEAWLKLAGHGDVAVRDRAHFAALVSRVMRQILVDHARSRLAERHGGDRCRISLSEIEGEPGSVVEVLALDEALEELGRLNATKARLVELRFFAGLTEGDAADALGMSRAEATRQWRMTRAWLAQRLRGEGP